MQHVKKLTTQGGFRLIRAFSIEHNARRLRQHCKRLGYEPDARRWNARLRLKQRFSTWMNKGRQDA